MNLATDHDFGFSAEDPLPADHSVTEGLEDSLPTPAPAPAEADPAMVANTQRERAREALSQLIWEFPDGSRRAIKFTSGRRALFEALRRRIGRDEFAMTLTLEEAEAQATARRYLEAPILIFLCLHPHQTWMLPRIVTVRDPYTQAVREVEAEPFEANFGAFRAEILRWSEDAIPPDRLDDAVTLASQILELTFAAVAVGAPAGDGGEDQKKTPSPDGSTST